MPQSGDIARNKKVVVDFLTTVFSKHAVDEGVDRFMGPYYRQHNPDVPDGKDAFRTFFRGFFERLPQASFDIKRVFCEGDYVTVHAHWKDDASDRGKAVMDIFRVEEGKVVEHWDVVQAIPERLAHTNTMF